MPAFPDASPSMTLWTVVTLLGPWAHDTTAGLSQVSRVTAQLSRLLKSSNCDPPQRRVRADRT